MRDENWKDELEGELLAEAFDECMEEQLSFLPSEREIARMHQYSEEFQESMGKLLEAGGTQRRGKGIFSGHGTAHNIQRTAACIVAVLLVGGIGAGIFLTDEKKGGETADRVSTETAAVKEETVRDTADEDDKDTVSASSKDITAAPDKVSFAGHDIYLAENQTVTGETDSVKTLVSSPVIARDAEVVKITIGNISETPISYNSNMELQVQVGGAWYIVSRRTEPVGQEDTTVVLEPGMAQDEEFSLTDYDLDYDAELYRIVTYVDRVAYSAEFRFESVEQGLEEVLEENE